MLGTFENTGLLGKLGMGDSTVFLLRAPATVQLFLSSAATEVSFDHP